VNRDDLADWQRYGWPKYGRLPRNREEARQWFEEFEALSPQDQLRRHKEAEAVVGPVLKALDELADAQRMHEGDDRAS
jgi:hypothetical protein